MVLTSFMSSALISKSKMLAFETIRLGETDLGITTKPCERLERPRGFSHERAATYVLQTPSKHDLRLILVVRLGHALNDWVVESHRTGERAPRLSTLANVLFGHQADLPQGECCASRRFRQSPDDA